MICNQTVRNINLARAKYSQHTTPLPESLEMSAAGNELTLNVIRGAIYWSPRSQQARPLHRTDLPLCSTRRDRSPWSRRRVWICRDWLAKQAFLVSARIYKKWCRDYRSTLSVARYKDVNPELKVPALNIQGKNIAESLVLVELISDLYPEKNLTPKDPVQRAQTRFVIEYFSSKLVPQFYKLITNNTEEQRKEYKEATEAAYKRVCGIWLYGVMVLLN